MSSPNSQPNSQPIPQPGDMPLRVVIVDISEHKRQLARDAADSKLNTETAANYERKRDAFKDWRGLVRRIWKGNVFREYYQQKYYREELDKLDDVDNLYAHEQGDDAATMSAVIERFSSEYEEVIHTEAGESRNIYDETNQAPRELRGLIKELIRDYASGLIDEDSFEEEKNRICALTTNGEKEKMAGGLLFADNLLEIANNLRAAVGHGRAIDDMLADMQIVTGEAMMGARTEARFNKVDKVVERLSTSRIGSLIPEATIASAVAIASGFIKYGSQRAVSSALLITGVLGLAGGAFAALRESKRIKQDRALHMRQRAIGKEFESNAERREQMESSKYESVSALDLRDRLDSYFDGEDLRALTPEEFIQATSEIAAISQRIKMSDQKKIDLIYFSSLESVEDERFNLDLALAQIKVAMRAYLATQPADFLPDEMRGRDFDGLVTEFGSAATGEMEADISSKDAAFKTLKRKEVFKASRRAFGYGLIFGALGQEAAAHVPGNNSYIGLGESKGGGERVTMLHSLLQGRRTTGEAFSGDYITTQAGVHSSIELPEGYSVKAGSGVYEITDPSGKLLTTLKTGQDGRFTPQSLDEVRNTPGFNIETVEAGRGANLSGGTENVLLPDSIHRFNIPKEYSANSIANADGSSTVSIFDQSGTKVTDLQVNSDGTLTPDSLASLKSNGLTLSDTVDQIGSKTTKTGLTPEETLWHTADQATNVKRTLWYGNDTPGVYDLNELRAHAGGVGGDWFDADGNVVIDITPMQPDGSFWQGQSVNPWELAETGQLRAGISLSKGTQSFVYDFEFKRTPEGRLIATISPDSPAHQLFERGSEYNGHGAFNGRYVEIMEFAQGGNPGEAQEVHMLATYVGQNDAGNLTTIVDTTADRHTLTIGGETYADQVISFTPSPETLVLDTTPITPIPIFARRGLEKEKQPDEERTPYGYMSGGGPERIRTWREDRSPRLKGDPGARLELGEELSWYRGRLRATRGEDYLRELDGIVDSSDVLSGIGDEVKSVVCIPVYGPGEADNIYHTLSLYAQQTPESKDQTVVLLNINWSEADDADPRKKAEVERTLQEIERAKRDFPGLKIATFNKIWPQDLIDQRTKVLPDGSKSVNIFGEVVKVLYDAAMIAVDRAVTESRRSPSNDALIITNDADAVGMRKDYLSRLNRALDENPETDAFSGMIRYDTRRAGSFPGYAIATNIYALLNAASSRKTREYSARPATSGANTAFRMSTFAAIGGCEDDPALGAGADTILAHKLLACREVMPVAGSTYGRRITTGRTAYTPITGPSRTPNTVIKYVIGAQIDTNGDRFLGTYLSNKPVGTSWDEFNGVTRDQVMDRVKNSPPEKPSTDIDTIASRLERELDYVGTEWYPTPALMSWALTVYFGRHNKSAAKLYTTRWTSSGFKFRFTPEGKKWLADKLTRDDSGRFEQYGTRLRRRLYNSGRMVG